MSRAWVTMEKRDRHGGERPVQRQQEESRVKRPRGGNYRYTKRSVAKNAYTRRWTMYAPPKSTTDGVAVPSETFRVVSFNVLADYLVERDGKLESKDAAHYLWEYRSRRLLKEILVHRPQLICLQEVDHFENFFEPELRKRGFQGVYKRRTGDETHDGCAIFFHKSAFRLVTSKELDFYVEGHPVLDRHNIAVHAVLETRHMERPERLVVSNTHILFNPRRGDVKLAQLDRLLSSLHNLCADYGEEDSPAPLLLCGDFNLQPHSALYEFLSAGQLDTCTLSVASLSGQHLADPRVLFTNEKDYRRHYGHGTAQGRFRADRNEATNDGDAKFTHNFDFRSAYAQFPDAQCTGEPKFTSFHDKYKGAVDYMWYTHHSLHCHGVLEMIPAGVLWKLKNLPTEHWSSDHISLVADFAIATRL